MIFGIKGAIASQADSSATVNSNSPLVTLSWIVSINELVAGIFTIRVMSASSFNITSAFSLSLLNFIDVTCSFSIFCINSVYDISFLAVDDSIDIKYIAIPIINI